MRGGAVGIEEFMAWLDDLEDLVKAPDWKKITLVTIIPVIVVFVSLILIALLATFYFLKIE